MPKKLTTNEDLVVDMMTYSKHGALIQAFIMTAITHYADAVIAAPEAELKGQLIAASTWKSMAAEVKERVEAFYNRDRFAVDDEKGDDAQG